LDSVRIWRGRERLPDELLDALLGARLDDDAWLTDKPLDKPLNDALLDAVLNDVFRAISLTA
jgi:hypothetical protein